MSLLEIELVRGESRRYHGFLRRADGVLVDLEGGSYNRIGGPHRELPHDLAHLAVEDELELADGVWGLLARGGLFRGASVAAGRQRPHAARRGRELTRARRESLNQAEVLVGAICELTAGGALSVAALRGRTGERWWAPGATEPALARVRERLLADSAEWAALHPGESLSRTWRER